LPGAGALLRSRPNIVWDTLMKTKLWGAAAAALMLCAAPAASAKVMVATYTGVVTYTLGDTSLFGPTTGVGSAFDLIFRYDTDVGQLTDNLPDQIAILGGALVTPAGPSPMRAAVIRIDGVTRAFAPEAQGSIALDFAGGEILQQLHFMIEVDHECHIFVLAQHLFEEAKAGIALGVDQPALAHAGIHQQSEGERNIAVL